MIICNPQPAVRQRLLLRSAYSRTIQSLPQIILAPINAGIDTGAFSNSFHERNCLIGSHRSAGIMTVLFKIEHEQDARARSRDRIGSCPGVGHDTQKMIRLSDRISPVGIMVCTPEQSRLQRTHLPIQIFRITLEPGISGFMNHAYDALAFHRVEIRPHHVVMRKIHHVTAGEGTRRSQKIQSRAPKDRPLHHTDKSHRRN